MENITFGIELNEKTEEEIKEMVEEAIEQASATFILDEDKFPDGFDTVVGERGIKLSGG